MRDLGWCRGLEEVGRVERRSSFRVRRYRCVIVIHNPLLPARSMRSKIPPPGGGPGLVCGRKVGEMAGLVGADRDGDSTTLSAAAQFVRKGDAMVQPGAPYNAGAWLLDRNLRNGRGPHTAVRCHGVGYTYADLMTEVRRVQSALTGAGIAEGERVLMVLNDSPVFVAWFIGCLRSGVVPVPVSTMLLGGDVAALAADCAARLLVISSDYTDHIPTIVAVAASVASVIVDGDVEIDASVPARLWSSFPTAVTEVAVAPTFSDTPAFWLYSSGTTGLPKGVIHNHGHLQATFETYATNVLRVNADDRFLSVAKLFFAFGLGNSLTFPFGAGATAILEPGRPAPTAFADLVASERPTLFFAAPGFVAALLDTGATAEQFASVRATVTAGEALPASLQQRFTERCGHPVLDGIGSTEALHIFISNTLNEQHPGSSGRVVPGYSAKLLDDDGNLVTLPDTPGYLHVQGPSVMSGYWNRSEVTAATLVDGWLRTGDVYVRDADDHWTFLGRNSDMIKAGGIWVSPAEVEAALVSHPDVLEAAVVGSRDAEGLEQTVAFVVPASGRTIDPAVIDAHCRSLIAAFKRPKQLFVVNELPKTATGKIQRFALRDQLASGKGS
jgi:benzoate-CoA ligase family protein